MIILNGKYNEAKVFTDTADSQTISQIIELCNQDFAKDSKIRIMPDCHKGAGCTIGTTMTVQGKVVPNLVGVDIGCAIDAIKLENKSIDFAVLDSVIREFVPSGMSIRNKDILNSSGYATDIDSLICKDSVNISRGNASVGTLGGGNHFIEVSKDGDDNLWLLIHSGSRNLGKQVAEYYQNIARKNLGNKNIAITELINTLKAQGRTSEIGEGIKNLKFPEFTKELEYLEGTDFNNYIHDMKIMQEYALTNRTAIANTIMYKMNLSACGWIHTTHNYIDTQTMILRKGAVSAYKDKQLIIPMNMRDGSLLCVGKGNEDWNCSAPHGAGRTMSRSEAKKAILLSDFQETMKDVWSTSVGQSTLDESPMAYKPMEEIIENIKDTVEIKDILKPLYNFKASE